MSSKKAFNKEQPKKVFDFFCEYCKHDIKCGSGALEGFLIFFKRLDKTSQNVEIINLIRFNDSDNIVQKGLRLTQREFQIALAISSNRYRYVINIVFNLFVLKSMFTLFRYERKMH